MVPFQRSMAAGETVAAVRLERAREERIFVLSGSIEITLGDDECYLLEEGDAIYFESIRLKTIANSTKKAATYLCMMTPPPI